MKHTNNENVFSKVFSQDNLSDNTYNGWKNYETWNFKLWIDNSEKLHKIVNDAVEDMANKKYQLAWLKVVADEIVGHKELCPDLKKSDIKNIDFEEILEAMLEDK